MCIKVNFYNSIVTLSSSNFERIDWSVTSILNTMFTIHFLYICIFCISIVRLDMVVISQLFNR